MSRDGKRPVTIEDLLRLKATERPAPAFWEQFDRELRAKQLSALVAKRPWWQRASVVLTDWRRYRVPAGALAMLAVGYFSVRSWDSFSQQTPRIEERSVAAVTLPDNVAQPQLSLPVSSEAPLAPAHVAAAAADEIQKDLGQAAAAQLAAAVVAPEQGASETRAAFDSFEKKFEQMQATEQSPSARYIAANLAVVQETEPLLARGLLTSAATTISSETRVHPVRTAMIEPLTQLSPTAGARRARFNSAMVATTGDNSHVGEREARGLSDERLYDSIRRVNAKGAGVLVKF